MPILVALEKLDILIHIHCLSHIIYFRIFHAPLPKSWGRSLISWICVNLDSCLSTTFHLRTLDPFRYLDNITIGIVEILNLCLVSPITWAFFVILVMFRMSGNKSSREIYPALANCRG